MVLEQAAQEARSMAIERTLAHRLALAWLGHCGVAKPWQIEEFWNALGKVEQPDSPQCQYMRDRDFDTFFGCWRANAGLPLDIYRWRGELTQRDGPSSLI